MENLTLAALTALHSLCHSIGLTREEQEAASKTLGLGPETWAKFIPFLEDADAAGPTSCIDLGFSDLILRWMGCEDEAKCVKRYGSSISEALSSDCGQLAALAHAIAATSDPTSKEEMDLRASVAGIWAGRAGRLARRGVGPAAIEAIKQALHVSVLPPDLARSVWKNFVQICEKHGKAQLADEARRRVDPADDEPDHPLRYRSVLPLTILRSITSGSVLAEESDFDLHIDRTSEEWDRIRTAVHAGRVQDIPLPLDFVRSWCTGDEVSEADLRELFEMDLEALPTVLSAVEILWGESDTSEIPAVLEPALRDAFAILRVRRVQVEEGYRPPEQERYNIWYEESQGPRRPRTVQRLRVVRRLNRILCRHTRFDSSVLACIQLDHASEAQSHGHHEETRQYLEQAKRTLHGHDEPNLAESADVFLATHEWESGNPGRALTMLTDLTTEGAVKLRRSIETREEVRKDVHHAKRVHQRRSDIVSWSAVAYAHMAAGHIIAGERIADAICQQYPASPLAWETKARVLYGSHRFRDAVDPARTALSLGGDEPTGKTLLSRILSRIGREGRIEAVESAEDAIDGLVRRMDSSTADLCDLAEIVQWNGGAIEFARTGDGYIWRNRHEAEPPSEWLGAAAARRCHTDWSEDAVEWLVRLLEIGRCEPVELARFITDRVDHLQFLRAEAATWAFGRRERLPQEDLLYQAASEVFERRYGYSLCISGCRLAVLAAHTIQVHPRDARVALSITPEDLAKLKELARGGPDFSFDIRSPGSGWHVHCADLEATFGTELAIRLRASQMAQRTLIILPSMGDRASIAAFQILEMVERERVAWIRWVAEQPALRAIIDDPDGDVGPGTRERLKRLLGLASFDDSELSRAVLPTRWHREEG